MLVTEARWHHDEAVKAGKRVLWRAIPNLGKRPAETGWSASRYAHEALNQIDTAQLPIYGYVWANELDLQDERGDHQDDWQDLASRYGLIGGFANALIPILRSELDPSTLIHFPAFTPDHGALNYVDLWRQAAERHDVIDFHAYDSLDQVQYQYAAYRAAFPTKPLALTEWHCRGDLEEERRVLQWLADTFQQDPNFLTAYRFIWRWDNYPSWWSPDFAVEPRPDMVELFSNPPVAAAPEEPPVVVPAQTTPGIDVSNWQGTVNWDAVYEAGYRFAMIKASEGVSFRDRFFQANWKNAKQSRHVRLGYHFARPSENSPSSEADFFLSIVQPVLEPGDCLVLDMEDENIQTDVSQWTMDWLAHITERVGFLPILYTGPWYLNSRLTERPASMGTYGLMLAAYQSAPPPAPSPWPVIAIWQYSSTGSVPGVSGNCDMDEFFGTVEQLKSYGMPDPADPGQPDKPPPTTTYAVGQGLLDMMDKNGDTPVTDEGYPNEFWSEAMGLSGIRYVWWSKQNFGQMFPPAV